MYKVLIVDDEKIERKGLITLLDKKGIKRGIYEAKNGKEALKILEKETINLLITDIKMPIMDGIELIKEVRKVKRWDDLKILINSGYGEFEYAQQAFKHNVSNYILKPIKVEEFNQLIDDILLEYKKKNEEQTKMAQFEDYFKKQSFIDLICKGWTEKVDENRWEQFVKNGSIYIGLINSNRNFFESHHQSFEKIIDKNVKYPYQLYHISDGESILIIHNISEISQEQLATMATKIIEKTSKIHGINIYFAFSQKVQNLQELKGIYTSLEDLIQAKFFFSKGSVFFNNSQYLLENNFPVIIDGVQKKIYHNIEYKQYNEMLANIKLLIRTIERNNGLSVLYTKHIFTSIVDQLYKKLLNIDYSKINSLMKIIVNIKSMEELKTIFVKEIESLLELYVETGKEKEDLVIQKIIDIVRREYRKSISLEYISEKVYLSPNYVSHLFKEKQGTNLVKYICEFRLDKSCEILLETNMKVTDIAIAVGFNNVSYFVTVFKNKYGITPAKYRKLGGNV